MKIAHVLAGRPLLDVANGVRKYVYFMAKAQAELGLEVAVFFLSGEPETTIPRVLVRGFPLSRGPFRVPGGLLAEVGRWRPDILHLHSPYSRRTRHWRDGLGVTVCHTSSPPMARSHRASSASAGT